MKKIVADLIRNLELGTEINYSITELAMLLEMNTYMLYGTLSESQMNSYECCLDEELLSVKLSVEEQREIVDKLIEFIFLLQGNESSALWAIGKACAEVGLAGMIKVIKHDVVKHDEAAYQIIIALDSYVEYCKDVDANIMDFLADKSKVDNEKLSENAKRVMQKFATNHWE